MFYNSLVLLITVLDSLFEFLHAQPFLLFEFVPESHVSLKFSIFFLSHLELSFVVSKYSAPGRSRVRLEKRWIECPYNFLHSVGVSSSVH